METRRSAQRIFGGDAARQRAASYAERSHGEVVRLDQLSEFELAIVRRKFKLDCWNRQRWNGVQFTYVVMGQ